MTKFQKALLIGFLVLLGFLATSRSAGSMAVYSTDSTLLDKQTKL